MTDFENKILTDIVSVTTFDMDEWIYINAFQMAQVMFTTPMITDNHINNNMLIVC